MQREPRLLTIKEASIAVGVEYRQLLEGVSDGTIPHYRLKHSRRLVDTDEVIEIMRNQGGGNE